MKVPKQIIFNHTLSLININLALSIQLRFPFTISQHIIERIVTDALRQSLNPLFTFLIAARTHTIYGVFSLHNFTFWIRFTGLYKVCSATSVQLETKLFLSIGTLADGDIFQRNDSPRFFVSGVFEVVEAVVIEYEPSAFPTLVSTPLLPQPAFLVRVEEGVHQVVAVILRYFEGFSFDAFIQTLERNEHTDLFVEICISKIQRNYNQLTTIYNFKKIKTMIRPIEKN